MTLRSEVLWTLGLSLDDEDKTDRILDSVWEEMTSDAAIRALTKRLVELGNERAGIEDDTWPDDYDDNTVAMMNESRQAITAALDAVLEEGKTG